MLCSVQLFTSASNSAQAALRSASLSSSSSLWSSRDSCSWKDTIWSLQISNSSARTSSWETESHSVLLVSFCVRQLCIIFFKKIKTVASPLAQQQWFSCFSWSLGCPAGLAQMCKVQSVQRGWSASQSAADPPLDWTKTAWSPGDHRSFPPWCPGHENWLLCYSLNHWAAYMSTRSQM